jgi:hypothetical protein
MDKLLRMMPNSWEHSPCSEPHPFGKPKLNPNIDIFCLIGFVWKSVDGRQPSEEKTALQPSLLSMPCEPETCYHLLTECNFAEAVWDMVAQAFQVHPTILPFNKGSILDWVAAIDSRRQHRISAGIIFFFF